MSADNKLIFLEKAAVFGSGAFGTALAMVLSKKCKQVNVWHMNQKEAALVNEKHENVLFLKGVPLAKNVKFTADVDETYKGAGAILFVIPTQFMRGFLKAHGAKLLSYVKANKVPVVVCSKGIERSSLLFPEQILSEFFPGVSLSVLAGPSFAAEVARGVFTCVSVCNRNIDEARQLQRIMTTADHSFLCFATTDTAGSEVASAMKNVLAIGSGIASGLGMGLDARAALIARGLLEIRDVTKALGGDGAAVFGLPGLGDLLLTCSSELSRNFTVGKRLGQGETLDHIQKTSKAVAEGVFTADPLMRLAAKLKVELPICSLIHRVVAGQLTPRDAVTQLISRDVRDEGLPKLFNAGNTPSKL
ncbi:putative mitochondrial glycerol-3-phosphate dehydrogenase [NAD ], glycosomal (GPD) [Leptomonas pyrrhocoris]|uniref:Glycerol-3-phosphate dehydrogenase [NAD(+)] n=1 Tax=Leptomonas pyrrhocoris TaxID=157538 RepID=A0A0M9FTV3_LEPPY|nr:putative mitochondrial glycerol-3-phosphate dehydrogenase [NAD ], glycosomal (GPD) [Leptomonas pyrrhocoris]KPA75965.1 putative mitochondrial glycerol-3-phosphate dehydrogenase [NAD ], glycosomal (GPD) [Leptomonas pyrrhocoris]|eukprot:XP_015654404.1 putative mitochondrial glycerol-3-phosphate dehydrogenase [NAD ], glycosomal (GPD) [Leptomonas pyrrhocoris]